MLTDSDMYYFIIEMVCIKNTTLSEQSKNLKENHETEAKSIHIAHIYTQSFTLYT
jgi:hypothetical protein